MKNNKFLRLSVLLLIVIFFIFFIITNYEAFKGLKIVNSSYLPLIFILFILNSYITGQVTKYLLKPMTLNLKNLESFKLAIVTGFYNLITPLRGGAIARAIYLKRKHNFPYSDFLGSLAASFILIFIVASILGIFSIISIYLTKGIFSLLLFIIFIVMLSILGSIVIFSPRFRERENRILNNLVRTANSWHIIKNNVNVIQIIVFLTFVQLLISAYILQLQFHVFNITISFTEALLLSSIANLALLIGLTPAGLGINEAIIVFSATTIGISPIESLSAAVLGRLISFIVLFSLGPIFSKQLLKDSPHKILSSKEH